MIFPRKIDDNKLHNQKRHLEILALVPFDKTQEVTTTRVDGRNPAPPGMKKNNGINYQPQQVSRISEPSTVVMQVAGDSFRGASLN